LSKSLGDDFHPTGVVALQAIILAGGYAKRLWPLTSNNPKPLLHVEGRPVIEYVVAKVDELGDRITEILIVTNKTFEHTFRKWMIERDFAKSSVVNDGSTSEVSKVGAIGALGEVINRINDDFLVLAGDCLFRDSLLGLVSLYARAQTPVVALYHPRHSEQMLRGSLATVNEESIIVDYVEKPLRMVSGLVGAVIYAFPKRITERIREYLRLELPKDEPGRFIEWLHKQERVLGYVLKHDVWDIGTPEAYRYARKYLEG